MSKIKKSHLTFLMRWAVSSSGFWIAAELLGESSISYQGKISTIFFAGLVLAVINTFIRPLVVFLTLPAVLVTVGFFMVFINAAMILLAAHLYSPLEVSSFGAALVTGLVIGLVQWLVTRLFDSDKERKL